MPTVRAQRPTYTVRPRPALVLTLAGLLGMPMSGCYQQQATYPKADGAEGLTDNPNTPASEQAMVQALQYVASRYGVSKREFHNAASDIDAPLVTKSMVVNLPRGLRKSVYERVAAKVGPNVQPATPMSVESGAPVYYVTRVWMRFNRGVIDVVRPMTELGAGKDGLPVYQRISVHLTGGNTPWKVAYARTWSPQSTEPPPSPYFVPAVDDPNQWAIEQELMGLREPRLTLQGSPRRGVIEEQPVDRPARSTVNGDDGPVVVTDVPEAHFSEEPQ
jgi:hypothetical protein